MKQRKVVVTNVGTFPDDGDGHVKGEMMYDIQSYTPDETGVMQPDQVSGVVEDANHGIEAISVKSVTGKYAQDVTAKMHRDCWNRRSGRGMEYVEIKWQRAT